MYCAHFCIQYNAVLYYTTMYCTVQYITLWYCTVLYIYVQFSVGRPSHFDRILGSQLSRARGGTSIISVFLNQLNTVVLLYAGTQELLYA